MHEARYNVCEGAPQNPNTILNDWQCVCWDDARLLRKTPTFHWGCTFAGCFDNMVDPYHLMIGMLSRAAGSSWQCVIGLLKKKKKKKKRRRRRRRKVYTSCSHLGLIRRPATTLIIPSHAVKALHNELLRRAEL